MTNHTLLPYTLTWLSLAKAVIEQPTLRPVPPKINSNGPMMMGPALGIKSFSKTKPGERLTRDLRIWHFGQLQILSNRWQPKFLFRLLTVLLL